MKKITEILFLTIIFGGLCFAQASKIKKGSTVYVAPMHDYGAYIIAALQKEHVPVVVILDRSKAPYVIDGVVDRKGLQGHSAVSVNNTNAVNAHREAWCFNAKRQSGHLERHQQVSRLSIQRVPKSFFLIRRMKWETASLSIMRRFREAS